jgi:hypothetical protein
MALHFLHSIAMYAVLWPQYLQINDGCWPGITELLLIGPISSMSFSVSAALILYAFWHCGLMQSITTGSIREELSPTMLSLNCHIAMPIASTRAPLAIKILLRFDNSHKLITLNKIDH